MSPPYAKRPSLWTRVRYWLAKKLKRWANRVDPERF